MSVSCDVNVLLYASDSASPVHEPARSFLKGLAAGGDLFCLGWPTVMSYLRIATHPGIFSAPLTPAEVQLAKADVERERARDDAAKAASDAEFAANMDRLRAQEDAKREQEEREKAYRDPVYWGNWGYGVTTWPNSGAEISHPSNPASERRK